MKSNAIVSIVLTSVLALVFAGVTDAADYPNKRLTYNICFNPGGESDITARFQEHLEPRGFSVAQLLSILRGKLVKNKVHLVVVLDEANALIKRSGPDLVYNLSRFDEDSGGAQGLVSLILISQLNVWAFLDLATASTFKRSNTVTLGPYDKDELFDILAMRARLGLYPGTWSAESLIQLGAQNLFWEPKGAYTGEISAPMLKDLGCRHVILGHSERRTLFGERGDGIHKKLQAAFAYGIRPILCIGESLAQREAGSTDDVLARQLHESLAGFSTETLESLTVAYEPIWAIGTGRTATTEQAVAAHRTIRAVLYATASPVIAEQTRILYGGSVTPQNIASLLSSDQVDGALIGGACLEVSSFATIINLASTTRSIGV